jgi:hypothetical protein
MREPSLHGKTVSGNLNQGKPLGLWQDTAARWYRAGMPSAYRVGHVVRCQRLKASVPDHLSCRLSFPLNRCVPTIPSLSSARDTLSSRAGPQRFREGATGVKSNGILHVSPSFS